MTTDICCKYVWMPSGMRDNFYGVQVKQLWQWLPCMTFALRAFMLMTRIYFKSVRVVLSLLAFFGRIFVYGNIVVVVLAKNAGKERPEISQRLRGK